MLHAAMKYKRAEGAAVEGVTQACDLASGESNSCDIRQCFKSTMATKICIRQLFNPFGKEGVKHFPLAVIEPSCLSFLLYSSLLSTK